MPLHVLLKKRGLVVAETFLVVFTCAVCMNACRRDEDAQGLLRECAEYVSAYEACQATLQGRDAGQTQQSANVRASLRLAPNATDNDKEARRARCVNAEAKLKEVCP